MSARPHFSIARIPVRVEPAFLLVSALFGFRYLRIGLDVVLIWVACSFVSILVHELGHGFALKVFGQPSVIVLHGFGGVTISQRRTALTRCPQHRRERGRLAHGALRAVAARLARTSTCSSIERFRTGQLDVPRPGLLRRAVPRVPEPLVVGRQPAAGAPARRRQRGHRDRRHRPGAQALDRLRHRGRGLRASSATRPTAASSSCSWPS